MVNPRQNKGAQLGLGGVGNGYNVLPTFCIVKLRRWAIFVGALIGLALALIGGVQ
jgi:hypothetical protein